MSAETYPSAFSPEQEGEASSLASRRGVAILILLSLVQFMDVLDASILNIALPSIKDDLGFSQQSLQWVINGYILAYGGFLLLGGRMADLLGRRLMLVTGLVVFASSSLDRRPGPKRIVTRRRPLRPGHWCSDALARRAFQPDQHLPLHP